MPQSRRAQPTWEPPEGLNIDAWAEFEAHRTDKGRKLTDRAPTLNARKLLGLTPEQQRACVEMTIERGWTGLFPEHITGSTNHAARPQHRRETETERRARINARVVRAGLKAATG